MTPEDATAFGVTDKDVVEVEVGDEGVRSLIFGDVLVRVSPHYQLEMHIDTDEGNAAELQRQDIGKLDVEEARRPGGTAIQLTKTPRHDGPNAS